MAPEALRGRRVLLFDSPGQWRTCVEQQLQSVGITPIVCTDPLKALDEIDGESIAAVVTDLHLAGNTEAVTSLILALRRRQKDGAPKLIIASDILDENIIQALQGLADAVRRKSDVSSMPFLLATVLSE